MKRPLVITAAAAAALVALWLSWPRAERRPSSGRALQRQTSRAEHPRPFADSTATADRDGPLPSPIEQTACTTATLLEQLRSATAHRSAALRRYLTDKLKLVAARQAPDALLALLRSERDPVALEAIGKAIAATEDSALLDALSTRIKGEPDPAQRAALVRSLSAAATPARELLARTETKLSYEALARDPAPEVREAVTSNLKLDIDASSGKEPSTSSAALAVATAAADPAMQARILRSVSLQNANEADLKRARSFLGSSDEAVAAAAARALGSAPARKSDALVAELVARFHGESRREIRRALIEGICRLKFAEAIPVLHSLRSESPLLGDEIDAWIAALSRGWQLWSQILREKQRIDAARAAG